MIIDLHQAEKDDKDRPSDAQTDALSDVYPDPRADVQTASADRAELPLGQVDSLTPFRAGIEYSPPARGTWTIAHTPFLVPESRQIFVCPEGCLRGVVLSAAECGGTDRFSVVAVKEKDLYEGDMEGLSIEGVSDILSRCDPLPKVCFVFTACIHHFLALDRKLVFQTLRDRFPQVDFLESNMNCTMRKSRLNYEEVQWRQNYAGLHGSPEEPKDPRQVNIIGSYYATDEASGLLEMLRAGGVRVLDLPRLKTYGDYRQMEKSAWNICHWPVAREACRDLSARLGQRELYLPYTWDPAEITELLKKAGQALACPVPEDLPQRSARALDRLARVGARFRAGGAEVGVDGVSTPRPFGLARLLTEAGFPVRIIYADAVAPEDAPAFRALRETHPEIMMSAMVDFRLRLRSRDLAARAAEEGKRFVAVGQRAAYFSGTDYFVNMVANDGLWGFRGIEALADRLDSAFRRSKDPRRVIQVKARGCDPCPGAGDVYQPGPEISAAFRSIPANSEEGRGRSR